MSRIEYFAPCTLGLEDVLRKEVDELGAQRSNAKRGGVTFHGDRRLGYFSDIGCIGRQFGDHRNVHGPRTLPGAAQGDRLDRWARVPALDGRQARAAGAPVQG